MATENTQMIIDNVDALQVRMKEMRKAQQVFATYTQEQVDKIFFAAAMAANKARIPLAKMAVQETGMGVVEDKVIKNHYASEYIYNAYRDTKTCGVIEEDKAYGIKKIAEPIGLIAAVIPTTNPTSTAIFKTLLCLKTRNAIIISPHPRAKESTIAAAKVVYEAAVAAGAPENIISWIDVPNLELTNEVMRESDTILATGGPGMVKAAYSSGKPAIGVGQGNVQCIIDEDADIADAVGKIIIGRAFDNGLICLGEQTVFVPEDKEAEFVAEMKKQGGYLVEGEENVDKLREGLFPGGGAFSRVVVGMFADQVSDEIGLGAPKGTRVLFAKAKALGAGDVLCREKLCPVIAYMTYKTFKEGVAMMEANLDHEGKGHSIAVHSNTPENVEYAAIRCCVSRVVVNQPSGTTGGGSPTNGFTPTPTLGCGTWGNNSFAGNLNYEQFINITRVGYPYDESYLPDTAKAFED